MRRLLGAVAVALIATSVAAATAGGGDGSLDPTFAGGAVQTQVGFDGSSVIGSDLDSDGRLVVFGQSDYAVGQTGFTILRYTKSGTLDETFGEHGVVQTAFGTVNDEAFAGAVQPDGKIVAAGYGTDATKESFALARYLADGSLDPTFGTGGKVTTSVGDAGGGNEGAFALALQPDGSIVVAGEAFFADDVADHAVVLRYLPGGELDSTFGTGGIVVLPASTADALAVALQADGKILVGTGTGSLLRLTSRGAVDSSFGTDGFVALPNAGFFGLALDPSGRILVPESAVDATFNNTRVAVERLLPSGAVDSSFGVGGVASIPAAPAGGMAFGRQVALQPDGKVIVAGGEFDSRQGPAPGKPVVARFTSDGLPDATFGGGGIVETPIGFAHTLFEGGVLAPDGRFLADGVTLDLPPTTSDVVVASYLTDTVAPACSVGPASGAGGRARFSVTSSDSDTGLAQIAGGGDGATVDVPSFTGGTRADVTSTVQQTQAGQPALATLTATDQAGNAATCTAGGTVLTRGKGNKRADAQLFAGVPGTVTTLTLTNGATALRGATVTVDGTAVDVSMRGTGATSVDLAPYLHPGTTNTIQLAPDGKPGSSALVTLH